MNVRRVGYGLVLLVGVGLSVSFALDGETVQAVLWALVAVINAVLLWSVEDVPVRV